MRKLLSILAALCLGNAYAAGIGGGSTQGNPEKATSAPAFQANKLEADPDVKKHAKAKAKAEKNGDGKKVVKKKVSKANKGSAAQEPPETPTPPPPPPTK
jgi:hypothetical protein